MCCFKRPLGLLLTPHDGQRNQTQRNTRGTRPIRAGSEEDEDYLNGRIDQFIDVEILAAEALLQQEPRWDMLHIDIQEWEGEVCHSCIDTITERGQMGDHRRSFAHS